MRDRPDVPAGPTRRAVLTGTAGLAAAAALPGCTPAAATPGTLGGADVARGHALRDARFPAPSRTTHTRIAIVGGGIAGLAAGWALADAGITDFRLLELEDRAGGNARGGRNAVSAYPLGAHYLPIPNPESRGVLHLLERLGIVTGWQGGKPLFDPYQVVADPEERLLHLGRWQEGLVPTIGLSPRDRADIAGFFAAMTGFRNRRDVAGRPAFAIPMELSSRDPDLLALDRVSIAHWLDTQGWRSPALRAHIRYACRDDYGTEPEHVSAWAGIHYFAARRGAAANVAGDAVLTWPEGNARLAGRMAQHLSANIDPARIVHRVTPIDAGVAIDAYDPASRTTTRLIADVAILAVPRFVAARLLPDRIDADAFSYAPWAVATVTLDRPPAGAGFPLAWDNVSWTSESLGYVVANHQSLARPAAPGQPDPTVVSWYMPLSTLAPADARRQLLARPLADWQAIVAADLLRTNPDLDGAIRRIDLWRWGHAMIRPTPGFLWGGTRAAAARPAPPLFFANSDLSGLSIFEEAHYRGTRAAEDAMAHLGVAHRSTLA